MAGSATLHGTPGHAMRLSVARGFAGLHASRSLLGTKGRPRVVPFLSPGGSFPAKRGSQTRAAAISGGASITGETLGGRTGAEVTHGFNGLSDVNSTSLIGGEVTPPDQGLCVGSIPAMSKSPLVWELVNEAARVTTTNGTPLTPDISLATLYNDANAFSDPRCLYDPATHSFFFTLIGFPAGGPNPYLTNTTVDVAVLNASGSFATYQFDTSMGGNCLGDQPKVGFDNNALVVSTDEYCGNSLSNYQGAIVLAISKPQLVAEDLTVNDWTSAPVSLGGIPVTGLDPAIDTGTGTSYLVNSFPFDANGNNNAISSSLGLWSLKNDASVTTGIGSPVLTGKLLSSEAYTFPVPAASTGNGLPATITSEAFLNPDDSRLSAPVEVTHSDGHVQLWTALDAALAIKGDPTARDGAAWFKIDTGGQRVVSQGYVAAKGAYLLYPAVLAPPHGPAAMVFTVTSTSINPSAAYTTLGSTKIAIAAAGAGPHLSFSDAYPYFQPRWGDYSFTAVSPNGKGVWLATEYIPPLASQDPIDNWGTYVFEVSGH